MKKLKKRKNERLEYDNWSIRVKLIIGFLCTTVVFAAVNFYIYFSLNEALGKIDSVYKSNTELGELKKVLDNVQDSMYRYLNTKSSETLQEYYRYEQDYLNQIQTFNNRPSDDKTLLLEKNIRNLSASYISSTDSAVDAKRTRNITQYKKEYEKSAKLYEEISNFIYELNTIQFQYNSNNYSILRSTLSRFIGVSAVMLLVSILMNVVLIVFLARELTQPLVELAGKAGRVAKGDLDVEFPVVESRDEIGVLTRTFRQMLESIKEYIERTRQNMERENRMRQNELLMKSDLKDAQLKYLRAQINPHFLYNTLNAGAQLAMMEGAEKTCLFVENMADYFRYNVRKISTDATLREEIELVDNYIYILNVRFSGEIGFEKQLNYSLLNLRVPSMILQPLVENAVNHGIRGMEEGGIVRLSVYQEEEAVCVSIRDNGKGIPPRTIEKILNGEAVESQAEDDSTGIGMDNVISRMKNYYEEEHVIEIRSEGEGMGTEIILFLPREKRG